MRIMGWVSIAVILVVTWISGCAHVDHQHPHDHVYRNVKIQKVDECQWYFDPDEDKYKCIYPLE